MKKKYQLILIIVLFISLCFLICCSSDKEQQSIKNAEKLKENVKKTEKSLTETDEQKKDPFATEKPEDMMVVWAKVMVNENEFDNSGDNDMIGAFGPGGEQDCRALGSWKELPTPDEKEIFYVWHFVIFGFKHDTIDSTPIKFYLYDSKTGKKYECNETIKFKHQDQVGNPKEPFILTANEENIMK